MNKNDSYNQMISAWPTNQESKMTAATEEHKEQQGFCLMLQLAAQLNELQC